MLAWPVTPVCEAPAGASSGVKQLRWRLSGLLLAAVNVGEHAHDVALLHDQEILAGDLLFGAGPLAEQHAVADLDVDRDQLAALVAATGTHGGDFALRGLFFGRVRNDDAASGLLFGVDALDHDAVVKLTEVHTVLLSYRIRVEDSGNGSRCRR